MKKPLRTGYTTGACAAAAAKAAALALAGGIPSPPDVEIELPGGRRARFPLLRCRRLDAQTAVASVRKDAGDDPDVTHGMEIVATVSWGATGDIDFAGGEGVGTVTKPGLQVPPGEPAINPVPRHMIRAAVRSVTDRPLRVTISIPGGAAAAARTFNPRLGVVGGLSILGTTGIVRPYCARALRDALVCAFDVAAACGIRAPVLTPGNIGATAARAQFVLRDEQLIEVNNEWGFALDQAAARSFAAVLLVGHPGKLAKLAEEHWQTHSAHAASAAPFVAALAMETFGRVIPASPTVEGIFTALAGAERTALAAALAARIRAAVEKRLGEKAAAVMLVDMAGRPLGSAGDLQPWQPAGS